MGSLQKNNDNDDDDNGDVFLMTMTKNHSYLPPSAMDINICSYAPPIAKYQEENSSESPDVCFSASVVSRNGFSDVLQNFCKCK